MHGFLVTSYNMSSLIDLIRYDITNDIMNDSISDSNNNSSIGRPRP